MLSVVSALSGVSIVSNDEGKLVVNMTTNIPTGANEGKAFEECNAVEQAPSVISKVMSTLYMLSMSSFEGLTANMAWLCPLMKLNVCNP